MRSSRSRPASARSSSSSRKACPTGRSPAGWASAITRPSSTSTPSSASSGPPRAPKRWPRPCAWAWCSSRPGHSGRPRPARPGDARAAQRRLHWPRTGGQAMADVLHGISDRLADVVEGAGRSVVRVEGRRGAPASGVAFAEDVVVTAHHVLEWDEDLAVGLPDGSAAEAHVIGRDSGTDLAALRVKGPALAPPAWSDPAGTRVGHLVLGLSRPG